MNGSDFGTSWDDSQPAIGRYYKTATNLPWALNIAEKFSYTIERAAINTGYLKFIPWAESSGATYPDWYTNQPIGISGCIKNIHPSIVLVSNLNQGC